MNRDFPRILTLLRKERGISQKEAAGSLGVSQALLSHYEKGIRECGLDFLVRVSDFYGVSTDYLLGKSPHRQSASPAPESGAALQEPQQMIFHTESLLFSLLQSSGNRTLLHEATLYMTLALYKLFRILHLANPKNTPGLFSLSETLGGQYAQSEMHRCEGKLAAIAKGERGEGLEPIADMERLSLAADSLARDYPSYAPSLLALVRQTEEQIQPYTSRL